MNSDRGAIQDSMYVYDSRFFEQADQTAVYSADGLIRHIAAVMPIRSVLDVGCGRAVWLAQWLRHGATDVVGVDGPYIDNKQLAIPPSNFQARDVTVHFSLGRKFDLVQSLEVAEHLAAEYADTFVDNLVEHGPLIVFSAAIPGQGGEHHVNEQPWEYWRVKFASRGYEVFDFLRPRMQHDLGIYHCYRFNSLLFAHRSIIASLPSSIRASRVSPETRLANNMPALLKMRYAAVRLLPQSAVDFIARTKYRAHSIVHQWSVPSRERK